jgi:hypothetical protein
MNWFQGSQRFFAFAGVVVLTHRPALCHEREVVVGRCAFGSLFVSRPSCARAVIPNLVSAIERVETSKEIRETSVTVVIRI